MVVWPLLELQLNWRRCQNADYHDCHHHLHCFCYLCQSSVAGSSTHTEKLQTQFYDKWLLKGQLTEAGKMLLLYINHIPRISSQIFILMEILLTQLIVKWNIAIPFWSEWSVPPFHQSTVHFVITKESLIAPIGKWSSSSHQSYSCIMNTVDQYCGHYQCHHHHHS